MTLFEDHLQSEVWVLLIIQFPEVELLKRFEHNFSSTIYITPIFEGFGLVFIVLH